MNRIQIGILGIIAWIVFAIALAASKISQYTSGLVPMEDTLVWIFYCVLGIMIIVVAAFMVLILALGAASREEEKPKQPKQRKKAVPAGQKRKPKTEKKEERSLSLSPPPKSPKTPQEWAEREYE